MYLQVCRPPSIGRALRCSVFTHLLLVFTAGVFARCTVSSRCSSMLISRYLSDARLEVAVHMGHG